MNAEKYGDCFWIVEVPTNISGDGYLSLMADDVEVSANGDLIFKNHGTDSKFPGLILSRGNWTLVHAASVITGDAVTVDHWAERKYRFEKNPEREKMTTTIRNRIMSRDGYKCQMCGRSQKDGAVLHVDHITPISKGGKTVDSNLQTLCSDCNHGKAAK